MSAKERIFEAAVELLNEEPNTDAITVRRIAERAGVGIGAVNYHFQSRDRLLNDAVGAMMQEEAGRWLAPQHDQPGDPDIRLRSLLTETARVGMRYPHFLEIAVRYELEQGSFTVADYVVPLLRELWQGERSEADIRLAALQLVVSIQALFLRRAEVARYTGYRVDDETQMEQVINRLVDNVLCANVSSGNSDAESEEGK